MKYKSQSKSLKITQNIMITLMLILMLCFTYIEINSYEIALILKIWCWAGFFVFIINMYILNKNYNIVPSPFSIFFASFYLFQNGQALIYALGITPEGYFLFNEHSLQDLLKAQIYTVFSLNLISLGAMITTNRQNINSKSIDNQEIEVSLKFNNYLRKIGLIMVLLGSYSYLKPIIYNAINTLTYGYMHLYTNNQETAFMGQQMFSFLGNYFILGIFILIATNKKKKAINNSGIIILGIIIALIFMGGARSRGIALTVSVFWLWRVKKAQNKKINWMKYIFIGYILAVLISFIGDIRVYGGMELDKILKVFLDKIFLENPILEVVQELGASMKPLILTPRAIEVGNSGKYAYGYTYIAAIMGIIPSIFYGGYSFAAQVDLGSWLMKTLQLGYGAGYSLIAESYYNFGGFGILFMVILGISFNLFFEIKMKSKEKQFLWNILSSFFLYSILTLPRATFFSVVRTQVYLIIIPYLVIMYTYQRKIKG